MVLKGKKRPERRPPKPDKPDKPPKVKPDPVPEPVAPALTMLAQLTGNVRTFRPGTQTPFGIPWSNVVDFEPWFTMAGVEFALDPALMAAMAVVESDANHVWPSGSKQGQVIEVHDRFGGGPSVGILQVKPQLWQHILPNASAYDPHGNIRLGTALMAAFIGETGSWQNAIRQKYHPGTSGAGTTPQMYVDTVASLMAEIVNNTKPVPVPGPVPPSDPIRVIVGGAYPPITYGWRSDVGLNYYKYGKGHGTTANTQHTGYDVAVPDETPLFTPIAGRVLCVGEAGQNTWGQRCGSYDDAMGGGVGNITILGDSGHKLTLGHCSSAAVKVGEHVAAGQRVGRSGGMNGAHVHVEVAINAPHLNNPAIWNNPGEYHLVDPGPALRQAMGGTIPVTYAERVPIAQPSRDNPFALVTVTQDGVKVLQRADPAAPEVGPPLKKGDVFGVNYQIVGTDGMWWWVSTLGSRVPMTGTSVGTLTNKLHAKEGV